jgi:circadian clock protein KaiC
LRNAGTIGINLRPYVRSKQLIIHASRPSLQGLEMHLIVLHKLITQYNPKTVIVDPISSLITIGTGSEVRAMLVRLLDMLKVSGINAMFTALTHKYTGEYIDLSVDAVSSLADTWISLTNDDQNGIRTRNLLIVKSRGMGHSNECWNFDITNKGIRIIPKDKISKK